MRGILKGDTLFERLRPHRMPMLTYLGTHNRPLNAFLARANREVRAVFSGPVSYASGPIEAVVSSPFESSAWTTTSQAHPGGLRGAPAAAPRARQPVVITEVGCCTYRGAEDHVAMGGAIVDPRDPDRLSGRSPVTKGCRSPR